MLGTESIDAGVPLDAVDVDEQVARDAQREEVDRRARHDLVGSQVDREHRVHQREQRRRRASPRRARSPRSRSRPCPRSRRTRPSASCPRGRCSRRPSARRRCRPGRRSASGRRVDERGGEEAAVHDQRRSTSSLLPCTQIANAVATIATKSAHRPSLRSSRVSAQIAHAERGQAEHDRAPLPPAPGAAGAPARGRRRPTTIPRIATPRAPRGMRSSAVTPSVGSTTRASAAAPPAGACRARHAYTSSSCGADEEDDQALDDRSPGCRRAGAGTRSGRARATTCRPGARRRAAPRTRCPTARVPRRAARRRCR